MVQSPATAKGKKKPNVSSPPPESVLRPSDEVRAENQKPHESDSDSSQNSGENSKVENYVKLRKNALEAGKSFKVNENNQVEELPVPNETKKSISSNEKNVSSLSETSSGPKPSNNIYYFVILSLISIAFYLWSNSSSSSTPRDKDWRLKVDPNQNLDIDQRSTVLASLKPILDEYLTGGEGVSTLLILSPDEDKAADLAQCLLKQVNTKQYKKGVSLFDKSVLNINTDLLQLFTEINLQSHHGGKLKLDSDLQSLLQPDDTIQAVLLRHIDHHPTEGAIDLLRLLFAYCDGENPVIPHRLIIMTATSNSKNEIQLRENFKKRFPEEHDFVDALMARISGHTLYVDANQKPIC